MEKIRYRIIHILCLFLLTTSLVNYLPMESTPYVLGDTAEKREYEVEKFDENLTIQPNNLGYITFTLEEGEEFEIIYTVQVKENLPIDIWFLSEDNYILLVNDAQFLFLVDGSEQQVIYTKKIVTLKEPGIYVLVMTNSNNQSVEANIICELRTYYAETSEPLSWESSYYLYPLLFAVIILAILLIVFLIKARKFKRVVPKATDKISSKKKAEKRKAKIRKVKKAKSKVSEDESPKKPETLEPKQAEPEVSEKVSPGFCGYCGKPVTTPYCKHCGREV